MAVGLRYPHTMHPVQGVRLACVAAGLKKNGAKDMVLIACDEGVTGAAVFTRNAFCAAPVIVARKHLQLAAPRCLLINSGNANAGTGAAGIDNAVVCCQQLARKFSLDPASVLPFSTGVIGQQLDMSAMQRGIDALPAALAADHWYAASCGIMTTDTGPKGFSEVLSIDGAEVVVTGICKGSGMICPDMATMLAFISTDAKVCEDSLQALLEQANTRSFNSITVDGDTSTNDALVLLATGRADNRRLNAGHPQWQRFADCIERACQHLAQSIIRDGEGATKFLEITVSGGRNEQECRKVAYTIAHSPLVKTAFFASDPNVGRLLAAVGRSGIDHLRIETVSLLIDELVIVENGEPAATYCEDQAQRVMDREEISISVLLGRGAASWTIWTTDLSSQYVRINAEYRT